MVIRFGCQKCQTPVFVKEVKVGDEVQCLACKEFQAVPEKHDGASEFDLSVYYDNYKGFEVDETLSVDQVINAATLSKAIEDYYKSSSKSFDNIKSLAITLFIFIILGFTTFDFESIFIIVGVLLIHELGHYTAMKLYGYKDVKMFFIPLMGAAVTGKPTGQSSVANAIISLAGPLPGIVLGVLLMFSYMNTGNKLIFEIALFLLFINTFNLLPFYPLDGGRLLNELIFSRNYKLEVTFKVLAGLGLIGLAILIQSILLGLLGVLSFFQIKQVMIKKQIVQKFKEKVATPLAFSLEKIPDDYLNLVIPDLEGGFKNSRNPKKDMTTMVISSWHQVLLERPGAGLTVSMVLFYGISFIIGLIAIVILYGSINI